MIPMRLLLVLLLLAVTYAATVPGISMTKMPWPVEAVLSVALVAGGALLLWSAVWLLGPAARRRRTVSGAVLIAVLISLLLPADAVAAVADWVTSVIGRDPGTLVAAGVAADKLAHFAMFLTLGAILALARPDLARLQLVVELSALGAVTEALQVYVPGRTASFEDWVADTLGAVVGVILARWAFGRKVGAMPEASG